MIRHPEALELACEYLGLHEIAGKRNEKEIVDFFKDAGHSWVKDDETSWCAAFVCAILKRTGYEHTGKLNARSYLEIGETVEVPEMGDIVVLWRISKSSPYGHVGFYLGKSDKSVFILGGNQSNMVKVSTFPIDRVLGYRIMKKVK